MVSNHRKSSRKWIARMVAAGSLALAGVASADIGVNFVGGGGASGGGPNTLAPADVAGQVPQANWNNATGASGTLNGLLNGAGGATSANLTYRSPNTWSSGTNDGTTNGALLDGYLDSNGSAAGGAKVTVTNVPYAHYNLFVYLNTDNGGGPRTGDYELNTSGGTITQTVQYSKSSALSPASLATAGTFIEFDNLSDSTINLLTNQLLPANFRAPISGIQIVSVPEPTSLGSLMLLGAAGFMRRRRA